MMSTSMTNIDFILYRYQNIDDEHRFQISIDFTLWYHVYGIRIFAHTKFVAFGVLY